MEQGNVVFEKSKAFALRIVRLYQFLTEQKREFILSKQVLKSGTSIGANIAEAEHGISRPDFLAKMHIAYKETAETKYWLELLFQAGYIEEDAFQSIYADCSEIEKLLTSITKSARNHF